MPVALIFGGCGGLGKVVVGKFKDANWTVISVDLSPSSIAQHSIVIKGDGSLADATNVIAKVKELKTELDFVVSVAGGFEMETIKDESVFAHTDKMLAYNLKSAISAGHVASHTLKQGGLLVLTGADVGRKPTPQMISYGISKAATHHLVKSLAEPNSGLPANASVAAVLPITLDTPANRSAMPNADFTSWTPLETLANLFLDWATGKNRPANGALITVKTTAGNTEFIPN